MRRRDCAWDICVHLLAAVIVCSSTLQVAEAQSYTFTRFVGPDGARAHVDGTGSAARFNYPDGIVRDSAGNLYVADRNNNVIRKITPGGVVTTFAGGATTYSQDGVGSGASFASPSQLAIDASGNIYVADVQSSTIRKITPTGVVTTIAGRRGIPGNDNGPVSTATFNWPMGVAVSSDGSTIYVAEYWSHTIRKISGGTVTTLAGTSGVAGTSSSHFSNPVALAVDGAGNVYVADSRNYAIRKITPAGAVSNHAGLPGTPGNTDALGTTARFLDPQGIAIDPSGNLWVSDFHSIRKIDSARNVTTVAGGTRGDVDGVGLAAAFMGLGGLTFGSDGNLYICNRYGGSIRKMTAANVVSTIAGKVPVDGHADGSLQAARFTGPAGLATDASGNLYVADRYTRTLRRVTPAGVVSTLAGQPLSTGDDNGTPGKFDDPTGVAVDGAGNIYLTEYSRHTIRKVTPAGVVSTLAGSPGFPDSTNATGAAARFNKPFDLTVDSAGNVFVTDQYNHTIRKITPGAAVTTFAGTAGETGTANGTGGIARFNKPAGIARDSANNLFVADLENHTIRKITPAGVVTTFAGSPGEGSFGDGPAAEARFYLPHYLAIDASNNVYVTEFYGRRIRKITPAGFVTTIGGSGDSLLMDGTGDHARFYKPTGIAVAPDGTVYVTEPDHAHGIVRGRQPALSATATIDDPSGTIHVPRQLAATPNSGTSYVWRQIRKPSNSSASLSSTTSATPTFTPDVPARFEFELDATAGSQRSITRVTLEAQCSSMTMGPASLPNAMAGASYSATISVGGGTPPYLLTTEGMHPGLTLSSSGLLSGTVSAGNYAFYVKASDSIGCRTERYYSFTVYPYPAPTGLVANASSPNAVFLTWNAVPGAAGYRIYRRSPGIWYTLVGEQPGTSHSDFDVLPDKAYLYFVRARDGSGNETQDSNIDLATTIVFTDAALGGVAVKAQHFLQLRQAVDAIRGLAGYAPNAYTDPALTGMTIKAVHLTELRTQLNLARGYVGLPSVMFTDDPLGSARPIKAMHINQLRNNAK